MKAKDAREISQNNEKFKKTIENILNEISKEANEGNFSIELKDSEVYNFNAVLEYFSRLGYGTRNVFYMGDKEDIRYQITWY